MRLIPTLFTALVILLLLDHSSARFAQQGKAKHSKIKDHYMKLPTEAQKNKLKADVMKEVVRDMGDDADEGEMLRRIETLTEERMRQTYPEVYNNPWKYKNEYTKSDDIWENGTVVRYMARIIAAIMAASAIYAYRDQLLGKPPARVSSARREDRGEESSRGGSESRKNR